MTVPVPARVDMLVGDSYVDITEDVRLETAHSGGGIEISRDRRSEGSSADPTHVAVVVDNTDGRYSPRNPRSPYYGLIGRNTPLRVRLDSPDTPTVRSVSSAAGNGPTLTVPAPAGVQAGDLLVLYHSTDNWPEAITPPSGGVWTLLAAHDIPQYLCTRVWARVATDSEPASYTLGQDSSADGVAVVVAVSGAVTPVVSQVVAETPPGASITTPSVLPVTDHDLELRWSAGPGGTAVTWTPPAGMTELADVQSRTWVTGCLASRTLTSRDATGEHDMTPSSSTMGHGHGVTLVLSASDVRAAVEVSEWPPRWDTSGRDVWVPLEGQGVLRRLAQGHALRSPIRRAYEAAGVLAYWPCEDGQEAQWLASAIPGHPAGTMHANTDLSTDDSLGGSGPLPEAASSSSDYEAVDISIPDVGLTDRWQVELLVRVSKEPTANDRPLLNLYTSGTGALWQFIMRAGGTAGRLALRVFDGGGGLLVESPRSTAPNFYGNWVHLAIWGYQSGGRVEIGWVYAPVIPGSIASYSVIGADYAGTIGRPTKITVASPADTNPLAVAFGHVGVFGHVNNQDHWYADHGHTGEPAGVRVLRLCREESVPARIVGDPNDTTPMGPQRIATLRELLADCEAADGGILAETRSEVGITYRTRTSMYNQPPRLTLDYSAQEVAPPLEPVDDDRYIRNDVTVQRPRGASARYVVTSGPLAALPPPQGVGRYDESVTLSVASDDQLPDLASWRAHMGTVDEARYPTIHVNLVRLAQDGKAALVDAAARLDIGDRLVITSPPLWLPAEDIDQLAEGYSETIDAYRWDITATCSPYQPWLVGVWAGATGTPDPGAPQRYDTAGTVTAAPFAAGVDTALSVTTAAGMPWTTDPADAPFDINVAGVRLRVVAVSGTGTTQTMTVEQTPVNGVAKQIPAGTPVRLWRQAVYAL